MEPVVYALITETHVHYLCGNYLRLNVIRPAVIPEYNGPPVLQTLGSNGSSSFTSTFICFRFQSLHLVPH